MKYLPGSKLGAAIAALYLLFVSVLIIPAMTAGSGHGDPTVLLIGLAFILTAPWSLLAIGIMDYFDSAPTTHTTAEQYATVAILFVSALINTCLIYLLVGFASRVVKALFKKPMK